MFDILYRGQYSAEDREMEAIGSTFDAQMMKLNALYEATEVNYQANQLLAEAKVLTEQGTCSDLVTLYTEASNEVAEKKVGILQKIGAAISNVIAKIKKFINEKIIARFKAQPDAEVEVPTGLAAVVDAVSKGFSAIVDNVKKIASKAVSGFKKIGAGWAIFAALLAIGGGVAHHVSKKGKGTKKEKASKLGDIVTKLQGFLNVLEPAATALKTAPSWLAGKAKAAAGKFKKKKGTQVDLGAPVSPDSVNQESVLDMDLGIDESLFTEDTSVKDSLNSIGTAVGDMGDSAFDIISTMARVYISKLTNYIRSLIQYIASLLPSAESASDEA